MNKLLQLVIGKF